MVVTNGASLPVPSHVEVASVAPVVVPLLVPLLPLVAALGLPLVALDLLPARWSFRSGAPRADRDAAPGFRRPPAFIGPSAAVAVRDGRPAS
jgi:hypothetical protein